MTACPACGRHQLVGRAANAVCTACGTRSLARGEHVDLVLAAPPTPRLVHRVNGGVTEIDLRPTRGLGLLVPLVAFGVFLYPTVSFFTEAPLVALACGAFALWGFVYALTRERLVVDARWITRQQRFGPLRFSRRFPRGAQIRIHVEDGRSSEDAHYHQVRLRGPRWQLVVGRTAHLDLPAATWLAAALAKAVRET
jgi:hypothetical protein